MNLTHSLTATTSASLSVSLSRRQGCPGRAWCCIVIASPHLLYISALILLAAYFEGMQIVHVLDYLVVN
ncbi:hypothetical protein I7I48_01170 [Histoplasma ohiense]|nr:hypothetical protein I7I48_01170 [Histoplasma ohiense (nom. inval.)]